jgi:glycosyltransferase involved in cell wall biosynthesis
MPKVIAIAFPNKSSSSETFIKAHVDHLPFEKKILYGGWFPKFSVGDIPINKQKKTKNSYFNRFLTKIGRSLQNSSNSLSENEKDLLKYLIENKIESVLAEYGPTGTSLMNVCGHAGIPFIVHFHGFDAYHIDTLTSYKVLYQEMFEKSTAIVVVSRDMKVQLEELGADSAKIYYNPYGVDIHKFTERSLVTKKPIYLSVGRFVNKKAPQLVIISFSKVLQSIPDAKLIMVGDGGIGSSGELFIGCKQLVTALGLSKSIEFRGAMEHDALSNEMRNAFAFVQHSVRPENGDSEGTPNSILEASATGLPIISTRHAGIKDIVVEGETGYLVDEYDVDGMANKMVELWNNRELAIKFGEAGRKRVMSDFTMEKSIYKLSSIIENSILHNKK